MIVASYNLPYEQIGKGEPVCIAEEVPFEIPDSWEWVRLGNIFAHNTGKALNASNKSGQLLDYITTSNLYWNRFELESLRQMYFTDSEIEKCTAKKGDLLVCEGGDIGRASIWPFEYDIRIQNHIHRLRAYIPICTEYYYYVFYLYKHVGWIGGKGIGIKGLSSKALHTLLFPLPPLNEQGKIVACIKDIEPTLEKYCVIENKLNQLNNAFPEQLKKSILQWAVQGKLVPQDPTDEPASVLLERIREEKAQLIKEGKIKKEKNESIVYRRDNSHYEKNAVGEICIDDEIPFDIPDSWEWIRLGSLMSVISDGTHKTPNYVDSGVPFLSVQNISGGRFDFTKLKYITAEEHQRLIQRVRPRINDILFCRIGTLGKAIKCTLDFEFSIFVSLGLLRPIDSAISDYIVFIINSPLGDRWIQENKVGGGTHTFKINLVDIPKMLVPVPPIQEQKRIIDALVSISSTVENL